jgi:phospholipid-binding lipoprotein MlaA
VGDAFLTPSSYLNPWYAGAGTRGYNMVNDTSLNIGDYESLKGAAIDPYVAIRDAYVQYRLKKVNRKGGNTPAED